MVRHGPADPHRPPTDSDRLGSFRKFFVLPGPELHMGGRRQLQVGHPVRPQSRSTPPPLAGIVAFIWSWRNGFYSNDLPEFSGIRPGNWRQRHWSGHPSIAGRRHSPDRRLGSLAPIAGRPPDDAPDHVRNLLTVAGVIAADGPGTSPPARAICLNSTCHDPGIGAGANCREIRGWAEGAIRRSCISTRDRLLMWVHTEPGCSHRCLAATCGWD